jgi:3-isopropylmalate/(R)-2-methylmalate dehydratase large subunit
MGGANNALAWGVGATEYAALVHSGLHLVEVPESIRFELTGKLRPAHREGRDAAHPLTYAGRRRRSTA